jgi:hypothetical protein
VAYINSQGNSNSTGKDELEKRVEFVVTLKKWQARVK